MRNKVKKRRIRKSSDPRLHGRAGGHGRDLDTDGVPKKDSCGLEPLSFGGRAAIATDSSW